MTARALARGFASPSRELNPGGRDSARLLAWRAQRARTTYSAGMKLQPGRNYPLGATFDGAGTNFCVFSEIAEKVELCLFDDHGKETRVELPEVTGFHWIPCARPLQRGRRKTLQPLQAAARPVCARHRRPSAMERGALRVPLQRSRRSAERDRQRAVHAEVGGGESLVRLVGRPPAALGMERHHRVRSARQGIHPAPSGHSGEAARNLRGPRLAAGHRLLPIAGYHRGRALAHPSVRALAAPDGARAAQLLGLRLDRILRAAQRILRVRPARRAGPRVQVDGEDPPQRRDRSDPGRRLQPHLRGQPAGAHAVVQGNRQSRVLPDDAGPPLLHGLHGHRETAST